MYSIVHRAGMNRYDHEEYTSKIGHDRCTKGAQPVLSGLMTGVAFCVTQLRYTVSVVVALIS